ncbi:hypothetical protein JG687_00010571 [Phytophthora cactorum]|uniref:Concanavalin A-like lectin/glucanase domain n=1 Tax=Phytophthora cactorum TaxID=29920 RepID=A0A8T1U6F9_9STRA|nr:hypothetical protein JG687_00010571 [Phytophthora cactorum]
MKFSAALSAVAIAAATAKTEFCGEQNKTETADYIIYNNLWGAFDDPNGHQCTGLDSVDGSTIAWHTSFSWNGTAWQVKSFANAALKFDHVPIANVTSIPSTIEFEFDYKGKLVANVAFDMFTTSILGGNAEYEVMVWLQAIGGAGPLSNTGKPIKEVNVGGVDFSLYHGKNGNMTVYSYVAANTTNSFSTDFKQFFDELPANNTIAPEQYLINVQAGTEPFVGNGTLTVSKYSVACTGLDSVDDSNIAWHTSYRWKGSKLQVKLFANAALKFGKVPLSKVKSIPSTIKYDFKSKGKVVANVAYDLFTISTPDEDAEYEIMVWLAAVGGAGPISAMGMPIKKGFTADFKQFFHKLPAKHTVSPKQYLTHVQAASAFSDKAMCGDWDTAVVGDYTLYNNLWGKDNDPGTGHQCTTLVSASADNSTLGWTTDYKWGGITWNVKGYPNVGLHFKPIELANVESIPTTINYTYEYEPTTTANVAYDLFTSSTPDGDFEFEIMVWLAAIGTAWPLSSEGKNIKNITVSGVEFMLNHGVNGNMTVFSYVASELTENFSGDLAEFIDNLPEDVAPDAKQYLTKVQCGTESYHAENATMTVASYTVAVNTLLQGDIGFSSSPSIN